MISVEPKELPPGKTQCVPYTIEQLLLAGLHWHLKCVLRRDRLTALLRHHAHGILGNMIE